MRPSNPGMYFILQHISIQTGHISRAQQPNAANSYYIQPGLDYFQVYMLEIHAKLRAPSPTCKTVFISCSSARTCGHGPWAGRV